VDGTAPAPHIPAASVPPGRRHHCRRRPGDRDPSVRARRGLVAQSVAHRFGRPGVSGSNPLRSTVPGQACSRGCSSAGQSATLPWWRSPVRFRPAARSSRQPGRAVWQRGRITVRDGAQHRCLCGLVQSGSTPRSGPGGSRFESSARSWHPRSPQPVPRSPQLSPSWPAAFIPRVQQLSPAASSFRPRSPTAEARR
jgi:hypothetical protein